MTPSIKKCKYCHQLKEHIFIKFDSNLKAQYTDSKGSWWKSAKCPDCLKLAKPKNCKECSKTIDHIKYPYNHYCSKKCLRISHNRQVRKYQQSLPKKEPTTHSLICKQCDIQFESKYKKKYCSQKCAKKSCTKIKQVELITRECPNCSTTFKTKYIRKVFCIKFCYKRYSRNGNNPDTRPKQIKQAKYTAKEYKKLHKKIRERRVRQATPKWIKNSSLIDFVAARPFGHDVDHIIPLNHPDVSGLNVPWNLQYLPKEENNKKSNQFDYTYDNNGWRNSL